MSTQFIVSYSVYTATDHYNSVYIVKSTTIQSVTVHCTLYIVHYTLYNVHCALYIAHYTTIQFNCRDDVLKADYTITN